MGILKNKYNIYIEILSTKTPTSISISPNIIPTISAFDSLMLFIFLVVSLPFVNARPK